MKAPSRADVKKLKRLHRYNGRTGGASFAIPVEVKHGVAELGPPRIIKAPHGKSRLTRSHPRDPPAVPPGWHAGSVSRQPIQNKPQRHKMLSPCFRKWSRR